jgi:hypothetical protein
MSTIEQQDYPSFSNPENLGFREVTDLKCRGIREFCKERSMQQSVEVKPLFDGVEINRHLREWKCYCKAHHPKEAHMTPSHADRILCLRGKVLNVVKKT